MFEFLKTQYALKGKAFIPTLRKMVEKGRITEGQYAEITGESFNLVVTETAETETSDSEEKKDSEKSVSETADTEKISEEKTEASVEIASSDATDTAAK